MAAALGVVIGMAAFGVVIGIAAFGVLGSCKMYLESESNSLCSVGEVGMSVM
jgi:phosphoribosylformylglycinamidine (FGAM) synthase-like enzyme